MTWTELHDAAEHQDTTGVITRARRNSEEAVLVDDHASTPLHTLCWGNPQLEAVQALIQAFPQAVTDQDILGDTPLHVAASFPQTNVAVVRALLEAGPTTVSMANHEGLMPLHMACRYAPHNEEVIKLLLEVYPYAARSQIKLGEPAPRKKVDIKTRKENDHAAVSDEAARAAQDAIELRFDALRDEEKRDGAYPLHMAIASGASRTIIELLMNEEDEVLLMPNKFGETPLLIAMATRSQDCDIVEMILNKAPSAATMAESKEGNLPLHLAAAHGCAVTVVRRLMEIYAHAAHQKNFDKKTPLQMARESGKCSEEVMALLAK